MDLHGCWEQTTDRRAAYWERWSLSRAQWLFGNSQPKKCNMTIDFIKTQALGNDFLLTERGAIPESGLSGLAQRICHRNFGVGADGLIYWSLSGDIYDLRIFNCDGSEPECSGNGLRCTAAYLIESGQWPKPRIQLRTVSGIYTLTRIGDEYEADMGVPGLRPDVIPMIVKTPMDQ